MIRELCYPLLALATLAGCASLSRSPQSGYFGAEEEHYVGRDRRAHEREATLSDMGIAPNRELNERETEYVNLRIALGKAEKSLEGKREREQYFKNKPYLRSDRERLEFLQLSSFEARNRWLNARGIQASSATYAPEVQALIDSNDIALGMTKQAVRDAWGEPELVEVSGNPLYGNERWHYSEQTSSTEGYRSQQRMVYFDSGRVSGWESH